MIIKKMLILANSKKHKGRCIAGISLDELDYGAWVRPVSERPEKSINLFERMYEGGREPELLDIVEVPLIRPEPSSCQVENWLISKRRTWRKIGGLSWFDAKNFAEHHEAIWINGFSTYSGVNDEIPTQCAQNLKSSICLIHVKLLRIEKKSNYAGNGQKIYALFLHNGVEYKLSVTDCVVLKELERHGCGTYDVGESLLTISIGEPFTKNDGTSCQYKLVAAIITMPQA